MKFKKFVIALTSIAALSQSGNVMSEGGSSAYTVGNFMLDSSEFRLNYGYSNTRDDEWGNGIKTKDELKGDIGMGFYNKLIA